MKIAIYSDRDSGTSTLFLKESLIESLDGHRLEIIEINRHQIENELNQTVDLFIIPGIQGETCLYYDHLGGKNASIIQHYVAQGGCYLGICAGGYYATTHIRYTDSNGLIRTRRSPFGFIKGLADGPVDGETLIKPNNNHWGHTGVRPMILKNHFARFAKSGHAIYSSGPAFIPSEPAVELASYGDHPLQPTSLLGKNYGLGFVMASGSAPYYTAKPYLDIGLEKANPEKYKENLYLKDQLVLHEESRSLYWKLILNSFVQHRFDLAQSTRAMVSVPT